MHDDVRRASVEVRRDVGDRLDEFWKELGIRRSCVGVGDGVDAARVQDAEVFTG